MNHWPFITAAYAITLLGTASVTLWAYAAMRKAEALAENFRSEQGRNIEGRGNAPQDVSTSPDTNGLGS